MSELIPCPFCGAAAEIFKHERGFHVGCNTELCIAESGIDVYYGTPEWAADAWNRRAPSAEQQESQVQGEPRKGWWCPTCNISPSGNEVTHQELHQTCGTYIGDIEPPSWPRAAVPDGFVVVKETVVETRPGEHRLGYVVLHNCHVYENEEKALALHHALKLQLGWIIMPVSQLLAPAQPGGSPQTQTWYWPAPAAPTQPDNVRQDDGS